MIEVNGLISLADYRAAQYVHLRPRPWLRVVGFLLLILVAVVMVAGLWADLTTPSYRSKSPIVVMLIVYLAILFFVYLPWRFGRLYKQQKALHEPIRIQITEEGVATTSSIGHAVLPWSHFRKWKEGKSVFLLYITDALFTVVPKRFFAREAEMVRFRELLAANVKQAT